MTVHSSHSSGPGTGGSDRPNSQQLHDDVQRRFTYHAPQGTQQQRYVFIRDEARRLAHNFIANAPNSRELSLALTQLEQAVMAANAAIARNEDGPTAERPVTMMTSDGELIAELSAQQS